MCQYPLYQHQADPWYRQGKYNCYHATRLERAFLVAVRAYVRGGEGGEGKKGKGKEGKIGEGLGEGVGLRLGLGRHSANAPIESESIFSPMHASAPAPASAPTRPTPKIYLFLPHSLPNSHSLTHPSIVYSRSRFIPYLRLHLRLHLRPHLPNLPINRVLEV